MQNCNFWDYDFGWVKSIHDWVLFLKTYVHVKLCDDNFFFTKYKFIRNVAYIIRPLFYSFIKCHNPSLGLAIKARACKIAGQERKPRNEINCEGINPHTPKRASTLGVGVPVDSQMFRE